MCQVSAQTVHSEVHIRDVTLTCLCFGVINCKRKNNWTTCSNLFLLESQFSCHKNIWNASKSLWWICCTLRHSVSLVQCVFRRARVDSWRAEKWKTDDDKNAWKHWSCNKFCVKIYRVTLCVVWATCIDSRTERTAP